MRSPRSRWLTDIERGSANSAYVRRAHNAAYAERRISGDPTPSPEDFILTTRMVNAGDIMGIDVVDHIILADQRYFSMVESGRMQHRMPERLR